MNIKDDYNIILQKSNMQRLTDIWQGLVRYLPTDPNNQPLSEQELDNDRRVRQEEVETSYQNLFWIKLVSLQFEARE